MGSKRQTWVTHKAITIKGLHKQVNVYHIIIQYSTDIHVKWNAYNLIEEINIYLKVITLEQFCFTPD